MADAGDDCGKREMPDKIEDLSEMGEYKEHNEQQQAIPRAHVTVVAAAPTRDSDVTNLNTGECLPDLPEKMGEHKENNQQQQATPGACVKAVTAAPSRDSAVTNLNTGEYPPGLWFLCILYALMMLKVVVGINQVTW